MSRVRLKVRDVANAQKMSQRKLSLKSGVDIRTVQRLFRDPFRGINTSTLGRLADVLQVDASVLIESVPDAPPATE